VNHRALVLSLTVGLPLLIGLGGCAIVPGLGSKPADGLERVDELLERVESLQAEALLAQERAERALTELRELAAPEFQSDPLNAYAELSLAIEDSRKQAQRLGDTIEPLRETSAEVFAAWTDSLESFGNTKLRRQSQARLAETRARCSAVHDTAVAAHIALDSFNADLRDQALFLQHDFNADAVAFVAGELGGLDEQSGEVRERLERCIEASRRYVETASLRGQLTQHSSELSATPKPRRAAPPAGERRRANPGAVETPASEPEPLPAQESDRGGR
jgi:hypothetical protein